MQRLTKEQAAVIGLYTGVTCGDFSDIQELAEKVMERPVFTHEFADTDVYKEMKEKIKSLFLELCYNGGKQ
jgi:hypothetical protein